MIVMIHQLLTAKLNCGQFSCTASAEALINTCDEAFATMDLATINSVDTGFAGVGCTEELDWYNNSGEIEYPFPPGATPKDSRDLANMLVDDNPDTYGHKAEGFTGISRWDDPTPTNPLS
jgi:predicted pyridoxine 5'-phosphate oxidase superfamily flavin-nucleotide-binding protein